MQCQRPISSKSISSRLTGVGSHQSGGYFLLPSVEDISINQQGLKGKHAIYSSTHFRNMTPVTTELKRIESCKIRTKIFQTLNDKEDIHHLPERFGIGHY